MSQGTCRCPYVASANGRRGSTPGSSPTIPCCAEPAKEDIPRRIAMILRTAAWNFSLGLGTPSTIWEGIERWDLESLDRNDFCVFRDSVLSSTKAAAPVVVDGIRCGFVTVSETTLTACNFPSRSASSRSGVSDLSSSLKLFSRGIGPNERGVRTVI